MQIPRLLHTFARHLPCNRPRIIQYSQIQLKIKANNAHNVQTLQNDCRGARGQLNFFVRGSITRAPVARVSYAARPHLEQLPSMI